MVRALEQLVILFFGLVSINAMDMNKLGIVQPEYSIQPEDYQQLKRLQSMGIEFSMQFQNISLMDLKLPSTLVPDQQDLQCLADMQLLMNGLSSNSHWALQMIDSWGSLPTGLLHLNRFSLGNYKECTKISKQISSNHTVQGKHCLTQLPLLYEEIEIPIHIGICFPASCSAAHIDTILSKLVKRLTKLDLSGILVDEKSCKTAEDKPLDGLTIFTIVLLSILGGLALLATLWDYLVYQDQKQLPQLVKIFSIRATSRALFLVSDVKSNQNIINCLHGIRCMSLIWIVYSHEYIYMKASPFLNYIDTLLWYQRPFARFILEAFYAVDTFLFLSGFLLFIIGLRNMDKTKGKLNVPLMYLHRYLRLTPLLVVAILIYLKFIPLLDDGPMAQEGFSEYSSCAWSLTLLYLQNYFPKNMCLDHTWYLAVDMQLYIISPVLLFALYKWGKKAAIALGVIIVLLTVWLFTIMMVFEYSIFTRNTSKTDDSYYKIYYPTHQHATPWLIGALFGYFMHVNREKSFKLNPVMVVAGWLISLAIFFTAIFAVYPYAKWFGPKLSTLDDSLYYSMTRIGWPMALCWVVFACTQGYGGVANSFLSSPLWQPLSRLSYSVYMMHSLMQTINYRGIQSNTYFSNYEMMLKLWSDFGFTLLICYVLYVILEAPLSGLESLILRRPKPAASKPMQEIKEKLSAVELESQMKLANKPKNILY